MDNRPRSSVFSRWFALAAGPVLGLALLYGLFAHQRTDFERLNITADATSFYPFDPDFQCNDLRDAGDCLDRSLGRAAPRRMLWLGNSQLNTISFYRPGETTAVRQVHERLLGRGIDVFGINSFSQNVREQFILYAFALSRAPIQDVVIPVVYGLSDQTSVRASVASGLLEPGVAALLAIDPFGKWVMDAYAPKDAAANRQQVHDSDQADRRGGMQQPALYEAFETAANAWLNDHSELFALRAEARGTLYVALWRAKHALFGGVAPSSKAGARPEYPKLFVNVGMFDSNLEFLDRFVAFAQAHGTRVHMYWAPVPSQLFERTDPAFYAQAKARVFALAKARGVAMPDLETAIPDEQWGVVTRGEDWVVQDLFHFRGQGHRILAERVAEFLTR